MAPGADGNHQGGDDQQQDYEGRQVHHTLNKNTRDQIGQPGHHPGDGTLKYDHPDGPLAAELAPDGRDGGDAGRIEQAKRQHRRTKPSGLIPMWTF